MILGCPWPNTNDACMTQQNSTGVRTIMIAILFCLVHNWVMLRPEMEWIAWEDVNILWAGRLDRGKILPLFRLKTGNKDCLKPPVRCIVDVCKNAFDSDLEPKKFRNMVRLQKPLNYDLSSASSGLVVVYTLAFRVKQSDIVDVHWKLTGNVPRNENRVFTFQSLLVSWPRYHSYLHLHHRLRWRGKLTQHTVR